MGYASARLCLHTGDGGSEPSSTDSDKNNSRNTLLATPMSVRRETWTIFTSPIEQSVMVQVSRQTDIGVASNVFLECFRQVTGWFWPDIPWGYLYTYLPLNNCHKYEPMCTI